MTTAPARPRSELRFRPSLVLDPMSLLSIAEGFSATATSWPDLVDPAVRTWRTIAVTEWFEAFVISWPVGGSVDLHGHGDSSGAMVVAAGGLDESAVSQAADGTVVTSTRPLPAGSNLVFGPGYVHDIVNRGVRSAVSVHGYSPVLRSMTFFEQRSGRLVPVRTEEYTGMDPG